MLHKFIELHYNWNSSDECGEDYIIREAGKRGVKEIFVIDPDYSDLKNNTAIVNFDDGSRDFVTNINYMKSITKVLE